MGRKKREDPERLGEKLLALRLVIGVSQSGMYALLHPDQKEHADFRRGMIYSYERNLRSPSLLELKSYVEILWKTCKYRVTIDDLVDDDTNLWF